MSTTTQLLIVAIWLPSGLVAAFIMSRRGHRHWPWTLLAVLLGPMALPVLAERRAGEATHVETLRHGHVAPGLHLLVGIDGSPDAAHATTTAVDLLRDCLGQVTLATQRHSARHTTVTPLHPRRTQPPDSDSRR